MKGKTMKLYTVGYEGCDIEEFTTALKEAGVTQVADLRKNPVSRKRGFSKRLMGEALAEKKIEYLHLPGLGVPTEWRKLAKEELITRKKMFKDYVQKILPKAQEEIAVLQKLLKKKGLALLCYEADASDCHRHFVAEEMIRTTKGKIIIDNLQVRSDEPKLFNIRQLQARTSKASSETAPTKSKLSKSRKRT